jgi:hypothetical protein
MMYPERSEGARSARCALSDLPAAGRHHVVSEATKNQANHGRKNGGREILRRWLRMTFLSVGTGKIRARKTVALSDRDTRSTKSFSL